MNRSTILLVEDHRLIRDVVRDALRRAFPLCRVLAAFDAIRGIKTAQRVQPDVVVMDLNLPGMNGIEATRRMKRLVPEVRIVIFTLSNTQNHRAAASTAGADAYVLKDAPLRTLMHAVRRQLRPRPHRKRKKSDSRGRATQDQYGDKQ